MARIIGLYIYPVKSARGLEQARGRLAATGLEWDRHWMLINGQGRFLSQRTHPRLARLVPSVAADRLLLSAPGAADLHVPLAPTGEPIAVRVWDDTCTGLDQGEEAARWVSAAAGEPARLVRVHPLAQRSANPRYTGTSAAPVSFVDGFPLLVCNSASLRDLNDRLEAPIPMERFRPNLVLEGLPPFAEDRIDSISIGEVRLKLVKPCTRCAIPGIDQMTGEPALNPLPTLRRFRFDGDLRGVIFGENAIIVTGVGAVIEAGMACQVHYDSSTA